MSNNGFEGLTNFLKNVPPTKAVLTEESLADIAAVVRRELATWFSSDDTPEPPVLSPETIEVLPLTPVLPSSAWIADVRQAFHAHGPAIDALQQESATLRNVVSMLKFSVLATAQPGPSTDQIIAYFEQILAHLVRSTEVFTVLHRLAGTVNAVMREHEE